MKKLLNKYFFLIVIFISIIGGSVSIANTANAGTAQAGQKCTITVDCDTSKKLYCDKNKTCQVDAAGKSCAGINNIPSQGLCPSGTTCDKNTRLCVSNTTPTGEFSNCNTDKDCNSTSLKCVKSGGVLGIGSTGICQKSVSTNDSCKIESDCSPTTTNLHCRKNQDGKLTCVKGANYTKKEDESCSDTLDCAGDLACDSTGKCSSKTTGTTCTSSNECSGTQICSKRTTDTSGTCREKAGAACTDTRECGLYQKCDAGKCVATPQENGILGAYCQDTASGGQAIKIKCNSGYVCEKNKCVLPAKQTSNAKCENNTQCSSGSCVSGKCVGSGISALNGLTTCNNEVAKGFFTKNVTNACVNCGECTLCDIINTVSSVGNNLLALAAPLAGLFLIIGGVMYMISGGNETTRGAAKQTITYAIVGLIIMVAGYLIVLTIMSAIGAKNTGSLLTPTYTCDSSAWKWKGFGK